MKKYLFCTIALLAGITSEAYTQRVSVALEHGAHRTGKRQDAQMQAWREYGLGQFIHWGVYSIPGGYWNGEAYPGAAEWIRSWEKMSKEEYDNLYRQFDPREFDADGWAALAKEMGVKYVIFTTKHHDGFCMWPSRYTGYTVENSPYGKDIVGQVVDAYSRAGIDVYLYFSIIDWSHPGYRSAPAGTEAEKEGYELFKEFTRNQLIELLESYPQFKGFWFDGSWDKAWINEAAWTDALGEELRAMRPGLIIGSRFRADEYGNRRFDQNGDLIDDFDQAWERELPATIEETHGNDWDCAMTVPENQWGYHSDWQGHIKTPYEIIEMIAQAVSLDGNFVLNFGPDSNGRFREEEVHIAREVGRWMGINGEAIYGTSYTGLPKEGWGYYTAKGGRLYLIVCNVPISGNIRIQVPRDSFTPASAMFLEDGSPVEIKAAGRTKKGDLVFHLPVPEGAGNGYPFVIEMAME